jgi:hypothetical protein
MPDPTEETSSMPSWDGELDDLLTEMRDIWGEDRLNLEQILVHLQVTIGDLARIQRDVYETGIPAGLSAATAVQLAKEMGNVLLSVLRWCDDLGLRVDECIDAARTAQRAYATALQARVGRL